MSKSKGNLVAPDEYIKAFGADTLRMYLMFLGPFDQGGNFQDKSIIGISRFLKRVWTVTHKTTGGKTKTIFRELNQHLQATVRKVSKDIPELKFNTAIAAMMEFLNSWEANVEKAPDEVPHVFLRLLAPFAPHMPEELWVNVLKDKFSIHQAPWPEFDASTLEQKVFTIPVTVNGRVRDTIEVPSTATEEEVLSEALKRPKIKAWVPGEPQRTIYVPGRVLNIVT
jgi:leucyl-tRNA synthetase